MSNTKQNKNKRATVSFASLNPYIDSNIVSPVESLVSSKDMVEWGEGNRYPDYLLELYNTVPTLRSIINGNIDFIVGDDVTIMSAPYAGAMNEKGDTIVEQVRDIAKDYEIYGGFALQIIRNRAGEVASVNHLDMRFLRTNKECNVFYYCEDWHKRSRKDVLVYPAFLPNLDWASLDESARLRNASSILFVKNVRTQVYPAPLYSASVKACELEKGIADYHLNAINNSFTASMLVNFNNGIPTDEVMEEIEETFCEKWSGHENGGRILFSWNNNKESATEIVSPKVEDFGERYKALADYSRQQIFTAFRANPNLFGIPTEGNGFSNEEYEESFNLYNRTQVRPVQRLICDAYDKIFGTKGIVTIAPFSMDGNNSKVN